MFIFSEDPALKAKYGLSDEGSFFVAAKINPQPAGEYLFLTDAEGLYIGTKYVANHFCGIFTEKPFLL